MINSWKTASCFIGSLFLLCACSTTLEIDQFRNTPGAQSLHRIDIPHVPFFPQERYQCGPAALAMLLNWSGQSVTPEELKPQVYVPEREGSFQLELVTATRTYNRIPYVLKPEWQSLISEIEAGNPVLVLQNLGLSWLPRWHYAVVKGVDLANNELILHSGTRENYIVNLQTFERTWQRSGKWAMVVLAADRVPASADALSYIKTVSYFEKLGKADVALQAYESAATQWPDEIVTSMALGNAYYQLQRMTEARIMYERALEIDTDYGPARNNLAQVLLETGFLEDAHYHAQLAVKSGGAHAGQFQQTLRQIENARQAKSNKQ